MKKRNVFFNIAILFLFVWNIFLTGYCVKKNIVILSFKKELLLVNNNLSKLDNNADAIDDSINELRGAVVKNSTKLIGVEMGNVIFGPTPLIAYFK